MRVQAFELAVLLRAGVAEATRVLLSLSLLFSSSTTTGISQNLQGPLRPCGPQVPALCRQLLLTTVAKDPGPIQLCTSYRKTLGTSLSSPHQAGKPTVPRVFLLASSSLVTSIWVWNTSKTVRKACRVPREAPTQPVLEKQEMMKASNQQPMQQVRWPALLPGCGALLRADSESGVQLCLQNPAPALAPCGCPANEQIET